MIGRDVATMRDLECVEAELAEFAKADLGGASEISTAELELIKRCAGLSVLAAWYEARIIAGETLSAEQHGAYLGCLNAQGRGLCRLGLRRRTRDVNPRDLGEYIAAKDASQ